MSQVAGVEDNLGHHGQKAASPPAWAAMGGLRSP